MTGRALSLSLLLLGSLPHRAMAQGLTVVAPLPGYECRVLDVTQAQANDPAFVVPVLARPAMEAPMLWIAGGIVIVRTPAVPVNGYLQVLSSARRTGWIAATALRPYVLRSSPDARCTSAIMSNGGAGFTIR